MEKIGKYHNIEKKELTNKITFIVHTFKRPNCIKRLLISKEKYYPEIKILVYDDSEYDRGVSWGRNYLVSKVETPYYILLDDDWIFTPDTKIEKLLYKIEQGYDIVAGEMGGKCGKLKKKDGALLRIITTEEPLDWTNNFFIAKKSVTGWREELKIGEHFAFFWEHRGRWKIGYEGSCKIKHLQENSPEYNKYRSRSVPLKMEYFKTQGIDRFS